ncbi:MAG: hypothetical protein ABSH22_12115, partial [Tepidisphaeraceae bacterium]
PGQFIAYPSYPLFDPASPLSPMLQNFLHMPRPPAAAERVGRPPVSRVCEGKERKQTACRFIADLMGACPWIHSLWSRNCVWWVTAMLYQSGIGVAPNVQAAIAGYNVGNGSGPAIVSYGRNPNEEDTYESIWFDVDQEIQQIVDSESAELAFLDSLTFGCG